MKIGQNHLFIPGPTNVPERVRMAMNVPMQDMRAPDFGELTLPLFAGLKKVFRTDSAEVFMFPGSGTGAWEAAITNTLNKGDKVLMSRFGQFSHLWVDMATRLGLDVECIDVEWGQGVPVDAYAEALRADTAGEIRAVFATHNETATGVASDIAAIRRAMDDADHEALLFVDTVSGLGSLDFRMDDWGVDLAVSGTQKGLMLPAGLGILCASQRAVQASKSARMDRCFFSFADMMKLNEGGYFPYTPPTQLFHGMRESLAMIFEEGLDAVIARHRRLAGGVRAAVEAWEGCRLCAASPDLYSDTVSSIVVPDTIDARDVISIAYDRYNTSYGSGLSQLAGKVFRIGHLGALNEGMLMTAIANAEMALCDAGARVELGSGVAAAQRHYRGDIRPALQIAAE